VRVHVVVPEGFDNPGQPSGGNIYDRRVCTGLAETGWDVLVTTVAEAWPVPGSGARADLARIVSAIPDGETVLIDGLIASPTGAEYRGIVNYYRLAHNVSHLRKLRWNAETSLLKTLAAKHKSTVAKTAARYKAKTATADGQRTCFEARARREGKPDLTARFGGIPLTRDRRAVITDPAPVRISIPYRELICRLRQRRCELCDHGTTVAVHQVAALARLGKPGPGQPAWAALMAKMRRKTLIVCARCHDDIHASPVANTA
jgi:hypothetical protein